MLPDAFIAVLDTFSVDEFASRIARARRLAIMPGTSITRHEHTVPSKELRDVYRSRAANHCIADALREQDAHLARIAAQYPTERWYIYTVVTDRVQFSVFSNEAGLGRACIDFGVDAASRP
jgi:hypothetical protein